MTTHHRGFTLVEMAIVLALIGLILGTGLTLLSAQMDQRSIEETDTLLNDARELLVGYALSSTATDGRPYLPCPDKMTAAGAGTANDGLEDRAASGACVTQEGNLPWVTLGLTPSQDTWSDRLRYRVTAAFSNSTTGMQLTSTGNIDVLDATGGTSVAASVPAIILSHGKNGFGAINATGSANPAPPAINTDETANTDGTPFVSHPAVRAEDDVTGVVFDDQLVWLSRYTLLNRMVQAGKLP